VANALYALENNLAQYGPARTTDPTGYERAAAQVYGGEIAVTSFNSWRGVVSPPAPFANEYGNRMHFGLHAYRTTGPKFRLEDLTFALHCTDPWDSLVYVGGFVGLGYNGTTRYGIDWGDNGVKGGGDDTVYTSGNGTTLVDEIVYVGVGNAWWPSGSTPQADMDDYYAWLAIMGPIDATCSYSILGNTGSDTVTILPPTELDVYPSMVPDEQPPRVGAGAPATFESDSWKNSATGKVNWHARYGADGNYLTTLFPDKAATLTINDLESLSYWTKRPVGTPAGYDWSLYIYTRPPGDASWYGHRFINDYASHTAEGTWTQYHTGTGMTFTRISGPGSGPMSLAQLKAEHGTDLIEMISVQTHSNFVGFEGQMDGLIVMLTDGAVGRVNFVGQSLQLTSDKACYAQNDTVTVTVSMKAISEAIVGGQFFLEYDPSVLGFVGAAPVTPFAQIGPLVTGTGTVDYAVQIPAPGTQSGNALMATLTFTALQPICNAVEVVWWRTHEPPTRLSNSAGDPVYPSLDALSIVDNVPPVLVGCPGNTVAECSSIPAAATVTATDNCGPNPPVTLNETTTPGGVCPQVYTITRTWTATDACGNTASCVQIITVTDSTAPTLVCPPTITMTADAALCSAGFAQSFDEPATVCATQTPNCWYPDRRAPRVFEQYVFNGENVLRHGIDAGDFVGCGNFYATQGRKYDVNKPVGTFIAADVYIPAAWASGDKRNIGLWATTFDALLYVTGYPILSFANTNIADGCNGVPDAPRFRYYTQDVDQNAGNGYQPGYVTLYPVTVFDVWYRMEIELTPTSYIFRLKDANGGLLAQAADVMIFDSIRFGDIMLQGYNFGQTYDIYWDNVIVGPAGPVVTDNCDYHPTVVGVRSDTAALTAPYPVGTTTIDWTATDCAGNRNVCTQTITVTDDEDPVITGCPSNITVSADAGQCDTAIVTWTPPTADDNCPGVVLTSNYDPGYSFPVGTTTVTYTATDAHGHVTTCSFDVTVTATNELRVTVVLEGVSATVDRCVTFELWKTGGTTPAATVSDTLHFVAGTASQTVLIPCNAGPYNCITARDTKHTLRRTGTITDAGAYYTATFAPLVGGNLNDDRWIDILDYGIFSSQVVTGVPSANTPCGYGPRHADIDGNGAVYTGDFTFININFLKSHEANCNGMAGLETEPVTRISVAELEQRGEGELAAGDLNHDGWLDEADMALFASGQQNQPRPGDLNCDGVVDFRDINPFVLALQGAGAYAARFPDCDHRNADVNGDGVVDFKDVNPFVALLSR
jgi:hypothetical protein